MDHQVSIMIMSGVDDGTLLEFDADGSGQAGEDRWTLKIGRRDDNDICLRNDTFVSRYHGKLHWKSARWWLEDSDSTNGTFIENEADFFDDARVKGIIAIQTGQLFRIGRTWLRIQAAE